MKSLGRPSKTNRAEFRPGKPNPSDAKFGQAKVRYWMNRIRARLKDTSESCVAIILVVMNLVRFAHRAHLFSLRSNLSLLRQIVSKISSETNQNILGDAVKGRLALQLIQ